MTDPQAALIAFRLRHAGDPPPGVRQVFGVVYSGGVLGPTAVYVRTRRDGGPSKPFTGPLAAAQGLAERMRAKAEQRRSGARYAVVPVWAEET